MKPRKHTGAHGLTPVDGGLANRIGYLGLVLLAVALMLFGKADLALLERAQASVVDAVVPVLDVLSRPVAMVEDWIATAAELNTLRDQNAVLKVENQHLIEWQATARLLSIENEHLKNLLNFAPGAEPGFVTGRIVADSGGAFVHSVLVNAGKRDGISKGQAVTSGDGLVGRVHTVGSRSVRVLLITDLNSRIPVVNESTRVRAILAGNNSDRPMLIHMPLGATMNLGDRIVTSGHGGAFPPGIPVGVVTRTADGLVKVRPYVKRNRLEYVRIVDYGLKGVLDSTFAAEGAGVAE